MTVVFNSSTALAGTDDGGGSSNYNYRTLVKSARLGAATGNQVRLTFLFGVACPTETISIDDCYFGKGAASGNLSNFLATSVNITFSGSQTIGGGAGKSVVSDWVTLPEAYDQANNYVCSFHVNSASLASFAVDGSVVNTSIGGYTDYGGADSSGSLAPSLTQISNHYDALVATIEIEAGPGSLVSAALALSSPSLAAALFGQACAFANAGLGLSAPALGAPLFVGKSSLAAAAALTVGPPALPPTALAQVQQLIGATLAPSAALIAVEPMAGVHVLHIEPGFYARDGGTHAFI